MTTERETTGTDGDGGQDRETHRRREVDVVDIEDGYGMTVEVFAADAREAMRRATEKAESRHGFGTAAVAKPWLEANTDHDLPDEP